MSEDQHRARSVNDFDTRDGLRHALKHGEARGAFMDIERDFQGASLGCAALGSPQDDDSQCSTPSDPNTDLDWLLTNFDPATSCVQTLDEELNRLQVLKSYMILDSEREARFERLAGLAARILHAPIALVSLVDLGRQWFMSNKGLGDVRETARGNLAFCSHVVISKEDLFIVPDATKDPRFSENPFVKGPGHVRFYAGAPLLCPEGYHLGTLCVIDTEARPEGLDLEERQNLTELAALVVDAMVERRREKLSILQGESQIIATTAHDLITPLSGVQMSMSLLLDDDNRQPHLSSVDRDMIETALACADVMNRICQEAIETFRGDANNRNRRASANSKDLNGMTPIAVAELVKNVNMVMEPFPKKVPLFISVDPLVPPKFSVTDDLKVFRSIINYLTNALKKTEKGNVRKCAVLFVIRY
jgi:His Kinase A (phospho-acceptor) domain